MSNYLIISTTTNLLRIAAKHVIYIQGSGNYSHIFTTGNNCELASFQLGQIATMFEKQLPYESQTFVRVGKSLIVNTNYIYSIMIPQQKLVLMDSMQMRYELSANKDALKGLKEALEKGLQL